MADAETPNTFGNEPKTQLENVNEALDYWRYTRGETLELLESLHDSQLAYKPEGESWQPLYYQFGCMLHSQLVYTRALLTTRMDFTYFDDPELPSKHQAQTREVLDAAFKKVDIEWQAAVMAGKPVIHWPQGGVAMGGHVYRLASHERLHHGQIISYFTMAHIPLPPKFKFNWAL